MNAITHSMLWELSCASMLLLSPTKTVYTFGNIFQSAAKIQTVVITLILGTHLIGTWVERDNINT